MTSAGLAPFVDDLRQAGGAYFASHGFPTAREEEWRSFDAAPLRVREWRTSAAPAKPSSPLASRPGLRDALERVPLAGVPRAHRIVLVDGRVDLSLSTLDGLPNGVRLEPLSRILGEDPERIARLLGLSGAHRRHRFAALNAANFADGAVLLVPDGVVAPGPIAVVHVADGEGSGSAGAGGEGRSAHPPPRRHVGEPAQATLVQAWTGAGPASFTNGAAEVYLGRHAHLDYTVLQEEDEGALHVGTVDAHLAAGAHLFGHVLSLGGRSVRNEVNVQLHGEGASVTLDGLFLARGEQRVDNHVVVDHARPHGGSQQLFKGIVDGRARAAFEGKIVVRPHASKTDAHQKNRNLVLSKEALVDARPQLEIYNDDVKCTHGSATGRLDADALFYMRARGLSEREARGLLTYAFAAEIADRVKVPAVKEHLAERILAWLPAEGGSK